MAMNNKCKCGEPSDGWPDEMCQMCWERYCSEKWWDTIGSAAELQKDRAQVEESSFLVGVKWCARQMRSWMPVGNADPDSSRLVYGLWNGNRTEIPFDPEKGDISDLFDTVDVFLKSEADMFETSAPRWARINLDAAMSQAAKEQK